MMPARATLFYLVEKYKHETQFENYLMDMLWAPANGMQFQDSKRYRELNVNNDMKADDLSGDDVIENMISQLEN